ncbi:hypothetical protein FZEAL_7723 [Fusarium zealandicum]|uniref:RTA1-like protein n=1 Tax=Fusarium zealandicum TaxID=1053134 RepID=A0A8H4XHK5_9HYPO|nr:hypothetical protein FZEAL_7723 [Fusarium zealandicum]
MYFNTKTLVLHLLSASSALAAAIPTVTLAAREQEVTTAPDGIFTGTKLVTIDGVTNSHVNIPAKTIEILVPTCIQTATPDDNGHVPPGTCHAFWDYYPSFGAAVAFALLFAVLTAVHIWQAAKYKKRWCWVIIMASIWETMAFVFRALSTRYQQSSGIYLVFQIFILLAPIWVNAYAYMTLGRMVFYYLPSRSVLHMPAATLAAVFVGLDMVSFMIQLVGGSMAGPGAPPELQQKAVHIYMGGIGLQELFIVLFVGLCIQFQRKMHRLEGAGKGAKGFVTSSSGMLLCALYFSLAMISVRIIYRLIEFSGGMGQDNSLITNEAYFYALEAVPMLLAVLAFNVVHPGRIMTGPRSDMPGLVSMIKHKFGKGKKLLNDRSDSDDEMPPRYEMPRMDEHYTR